MLRPEALNNCTECFQCHLDDVVIRCSIDSSNTIRFTTFLKNIIFELSFIISLKSIRNIMCDDVFFKALKMISAFLSFHKLFILRGIIHLCLNIKIRLIHSLKEELCCLVSFFWFIRFNILYYFLLVEKKASFPLSLFYEACSLICTSIWKWALFGNLSVFSNLFYNFKPTFEIIIILTL